MQRAVTSLLTANKDVVSITVCGHSLGGALAAMCAFDLAVSEINKAFSRPFLCTRQGFLHPRAVALFIRAYALPDVADCLMFRP